MSTFYLVRVMQSYQGALQRALSAPGNRAIFEDRGSSRYASGSTEYEVVVLSPSTPEHIAETLRCDGCGGYVAVRALSAAEIEEWS